MVFTDAFGRTDTWTLESIKNCVGPGWGDILDRLVADLFALGWDGTLHQVKEKFGGLRFYVGCGSDAIFDRIDQADAESCKTCEECGAPGKAWPGWYWWVTHCAACNLERWNREKGHLAGVDDSTSYESWAARAARAGSPEPALHPFEPCREGDEGDDPAHNFTCALLCVVCGLPRDKHTEPAPPEEKP